MNKKNTTSSPQEKIEQKTAALFPQIHSNNSLDDIKAYEYNTKKIFQSYFDFINQPSFLDDKISLEVGCGGRCAGINLLSNFRLRKIFAIDLSDSNVTSTSKLVSQFGFPNVTIRQGSALLIPYANEEFNFVMSDGVIHHTIDTKKAFLEITRVLSPGGIVFLGIYGYGGIFGCIFPMGKHIGKLLPFKFISSIVNATGFLRSQEYSILDWLYTPIQRNYRASTIENWLSEAGYKNIKRIKSTKWFFNMGLLSTILFGNGYLYYFAQKPSKN